MNTALHEFASYIIRALQRGGMDRVNIIAAAVAFCLSPVIAGYAMRRRRPDRPNEFLSQLLAGAVMLLYGVQLLLWPDHADAAGNVRGVALLAALICLLLNAFIYGRRARSERMRNSVPVSTVAVEKANKAWPPAPKSH